MSVDTEKYRLGGSSCIFQKPIIRKETRYKNVKFMFPYNEPNTFHAELGIYGSDGIVIAHTNSYIDDTIVNYTEYEKQHRIYARINHTYDLLCNTSPEECIEEPVVSFMSPFDSVNFGHNLSIVLDFIHNYKELGLNIPIVVSDVSRNFPNILSILELFFDDIRFIENNKVYLLKEVYFFKPIILDVSLHKNVIHDITQRSFALVPDRDSYKNKKVFLVKLANHNKNIVKPDTVYEASALLDKLRGDPRWIVINPEKMSIYEIIAYLVHAKLIVTSIGAISYGHGIFFNRDAPLYFLGGSPYFYINWMKELKLGRDLDQHIDTIYNLEETIPPSRPSRVQNKRPLWFLNVRA